MGALDKIFLNGTKLEAVWNQIKNNFFPRTATASNSDATITLSPNTGAAAITTYTVTIGAGKVTNDMLAGSIANSKLVNSKITINSHDYNLGDTVTLDNFLSYLSANSSNGVVQLYNGKIPLSVIPDTIMGQMMYAGTVNGTGVVSLSDNAKTKWGITSLTLTSSNYSDYQGAYFIASADGSSGVPSTLGIQVGDWIVATARAWEKIDNTDAVTTINSGTGAITLGLAVGTGNNATKIKLTASGTGATASDSSFITVPYATQAASLTTVSQTLWGNTYWTSGGVPTSIGTSASPAALSYVTNIDSLVYFDTTNSRVGIGTSSPSKKLSVSGTFGVSGASTLSSTLNVTGATTLSSTLSVSDVATFSSTVRLPGIMRTGLQIYDGSNYKDILGFNNSQRLVFGMGTAQAGYDTFIGGKNVVIQTGTTPTTEATFSTTGLEVKHDIKSTLGDIYALAGGVAAYGIADLDMASGGGGGTGDVTSIKFGSANTITPVDGLLSVPVGQGSSNGTILIGGAEVAVKGLGSLAYLNTVPIATSGAIGGIKIGFTTDAANRNYAVALSSEKAYVNVPWTDTKVTSVANHYTPTSESYTPTSGSWTWGSTEVVTGITKDSKGHIVGVTTTSIANPNSNTWRNVYVGGTSSVGTGTNTKAVNYKAGTNLSVSFQAAGTGSGQSGSANYFNVVFSHATSGATAGSYGDSAAQTPAFGGTFKVPYITIDAQGHVTGISEHNVTIPATVATGSALGLVKVGSTLAISSGVLNQKSGIVTAGTYRSVTVDTYGRVTAGSNPTTIAGYGITDAKLEHANGTAGTNTVHKITLGNKVLYIYFNSAETTDTDSNKLGSFDITISDKADPTASGANTKTFSFGTLTKAQIESICTL